MKPVRDKTLWKVAKKRVAFRRHFYTYLMVNTLIWVLWYFTSTSPAMYHELPWPAWVSLGWGIVVAFSYYDAFYGNQKQSTEREYQRLAQKKKE